MTLMKFGYKVQIRTIPVKQMIKSPRESIMITPLAETWKIKEQIFSLIISLTDA
jgi:hypothetical protein